MLQGPYDPRDASIRSQPFLDSDSRAYLARGGPSQVAVRPHLPQLTTRVSSIGFWDVSLANESPALIYWRLGGLRRVDRSF